jgi:hypothetical protein
MATRAFALTLAAIGALGVAATGYAQANPSPTRSPVVVVSPEYPFIAAQARVAPVIKANVMVGSDGKVTAISQLPRVPLLEKAVGDALSQWLFTESDSPTPVVITVAFRVRTLSCDEPPHRLGYAVFRPPLDVEVWGYGFTTCDPVAPKPRRP